MPKSKSMPSVTYLRECFDYNPMTGALTWKRRPREHFATARAWSKFNTQFASKIAGSLDNQGYCGVSINDKRFSAHRIIFKMMTGEEPPDTVDHRHGGESDNRWINLRPATQAEQNRNRVSDRRNTSGYRGVFPTPAGQWRVRIGGRNIGTFVTPEAASEAYEKAARELHGEFYRPPNR